MGQNSLYFDFLKDKSRVIIYFLILFAVASGHYILVRVPIDIFGAISNTLRPMLTFFCIFGSLLLFIRSRTEGGRARIMYAFIMLMCGLIGVFSLIKGFKTGNNVVFEYKHLSTSLLIYGTTYAYIFLLYPVEVLRPGWLNLKRSLLLVLPGVLLVFVCSQFTYLWIRSLVLMYPVIGLILIIRYHRDYEQYCINNYAMLKELNINWLNDYVFGYFVITLSYIYVMLSNEPRTGLMHRMIFLFFFLYGFYHVIFQRNPYPEGYFKDGLDDDKVVRKEILELIPDCAGKDCESENKTLFSEKLPEYKEKLEEWMNIEKPYLRKDFKLTDAMEILPLNRTYLSRLFNDGYGETFYQYVMRHRIAESKHLLLSRPDLSITVVADLSGFSSLSVFSRAFTQEVNCSPMQWRERGFEG